MGNNKQSGSKNSKAGLFILLAVILILAGVLVFLMFRNKDDGSGSGDGGSSGGNGGLTVVTTESRDSKASESGDSEELTASQSAAQPEEKTEEPSTVKTEEPLSEKTEEPTVEKTEKLTEEQTTEKATEAARTYKFRSKKLRDQHYEKHGIDMGFPDVDSYVAAANEVINDPESLYKVEKEDGDDVYYRERDNAFVVVSRDGYIRTFFYPDGGKKYFDRQ